MSEMQEQEHVIEGSLILHELEKFNRGPLKAFYADKNITAKRKFQVLCRFVLIRMDAREGGDPDQVRKRVAALKRAMEAKWNENVDTERGHTGQPSGV